MQALERFKNHQSDVEERRNSVSQELTKLERHIKYFDEQLQLLNKYSDNGGATDCQNVLKDLKAARHKNQSILDELNSPFLAECALEELVEQRRLLEDEVEKQRIVLVSTLKTVIEETNKLLEMQHESRNLSFYSQPVCLALNQNPLMHIGVGGIYELKSLAEDVKTSVNQITAK